MESLDVLASRLPDGAVTTEPQILRERAIDSWTLALLRQVRGEELPVPAAVIFAASTEEVATVLAWAGETGTAVSPRGAGSGVCGGAQAQAGSVVLDLSRMNEVTGLDLVSRVVDVQAGVRGDQLEDALAAEGLTVGHYPQSAAISTVGGWIAASSAGQASAGFGAIEDVLLGLTAVLPRGEILRCRPVPRSAAGPDLRRLLVGSEGTLAVVTEATLACQALASGLAVASVRIPLIQRAGGRPAGGRAGADRSRRHPGLRLDRRGWDSGGPDGRAAGVPRRSQVPVRVLADAAGLPPGHRAARGRRAGRRPRARIATVPADHRDRLAPVVAVAPHQPGSRPRRQPQPARFCPGQPHRLTRRPVKPERDPPRPAPSARPEIAGDPVGHLLRHGPVGGQLPAGDGEKTTQLPNDPVFPRQVIRFAVCP